MSNLCGYGPVSGRMNATRADRATGAKGRVRATMWADAKAAHDARCLRAVEVRASDFFGPQVTESSFGQRVVLRGPRILAGKGVPLLGHLDVAHSNTYMPDAARVLAAVAESADHDVTLFGRTWLVPSIDSTHVALADAARHRRRLQFDAITEHVVRRTTDLPAAAPGVGCDTLRVR
ncbi:MAG: hypothetical protein ABIR32_20625 [Ilumatobacteraceae bacterium]